MREGGTAHDRAPRGQPGGARRSLGPLRLIVGVAAVLVLAIVAALMLQGGGPASRTTSFRAAGLYLEYPAGWKAVRPPSHPADREWLVLLTNQPALPDPCGGAPTGSPAPAGTGSLCPVLHYVVDPNSVVVTVTVFYDSSPQDVLRSQGVRGAGPATVDGRQGWTGVVDPNPGSDAEQAVVWILPMTASSGAAYEIRADLRGPQLSQRLEDVRRIVASVQL
jgi:hypothetical protein